MICALICPTLCISRFIPPPGVRTFDEFAMICVWLLTHIEWHIYLYIYHIFWIGLPCRQINHDQGWYGTKNVRNKLAAQHVVVYGPASQFTILNPKHLPGEGVSSTIKKTLKNRRNWPGDHQLGGGNSNLFFDFHPESWGRFPFWLIFFNWVEITN